MAEATRITVGKNDEATVVAEQLIDADTESIIFVIPKGSVFSQSLNNFKLLKREGDVLGKEIIVESDDPLTQERAVKAGLEIGETVSSDEEQEAEDLPLPRAVSGRLPRGRSLRVKTAPDDDSVEPIHKLAKVKRKIAPVAAEQVIDADVPPLSDEEESEISHGEPTRPLKKRGGPFWTRRRIAVITTIAIIAAAGFYLSMVVLPRATVMVSTKKDTWQFSGNIVVDKSVSKLDVATAKIPGQVFTQKNTATTKMPATGNRFVERKASGVLTVYNAYSSQPQNIVANTRFVTASGVVFRIAKALVIPGAKIEDGNIIPSSVTVEVVADKTGPSGNVGTTARLTIPGFSKTPKYSGFYGELKDGTTGGFSGQTKVATDADIAAAKAEGAKSAEQLVRGQITGQIPEGFTAVDSATRFSVTSQKVDIVAGTDGNFTVTTEAQLSVFAFREQDVRDFLTAKLSADKPKFKVDTEDLKYTGGSTQSTITAGRMGLAVIYKAGLSYDLDVEALRAKIVGQPEIKLSQLVLGTEGVSGGSVNLWPFYVRTVPSNGEKITITVQ